MGFYYDLYMVWDYILLCVWFSSCCWSSTICNLSRDVNYINLLSTMCRRLSLVVAFLFNIGLSFILYIFIRMLFFGYSAMAGIVMFLMCGAMGFTATYIFVRTIFG